MKILCEWCQKNEAEFELAVYNLKAMKTFKRSAHVDSPTMVEYDVTGRGDLYASIKVCEKCLPVTKQTVRQAYGRQK